MTEDKKSVPSSPAPEFSHGDGLPRGGALQLRASIAASPSSTAATGETPLKPYDDEVSRKTWMGETPRTDAEDERIRSQGDSGNPAADWEAAFLNMKFFARQLERELAEARFECNEVKIIAKREHDLACKYHEQLNAASQEGASSTAGPATRMATCGAAPSALSARGASQVLLDACREWQKHADHKDGLDNVESALYGAIVIALRQAQPTERVPPNAWIIYKPGEVPMRVRAVDGWKVEDDSEQRAEGVAMEVPQLWRVFCPKCKYEWSVDYRHPGSELCADCKPDSPSGPESR